VCSIRRMSGALMERKRESTEVETADAVGFDELLDRAAAEQRVERGFRVFSIEEDASITAMQARHLESRDAS
jgi:hypothetical protein